MNQSYEGILEPCSVEEGHEALREYIDFYYNFSEKVLGATALTDTSRYLTIKLLSSFCHRLATAILKTAYIENEEVASKVKRTCVALTFLIEAAEYLSDQQNMATDVAITQLGHRLDLYGVINWKDLCDGALGVRGAQKSQ